MPAYSTAARTRSWPETAALARSWRRTVTTDEPERLTAWQAPLAVAFWTVVLYGVLPTTWPVAALIAAVMILGGMRRRSPDIRTPAAASRPLLR